MGLETLLGDCSLIPALKQDQVYLDHPINTSCEGESPVSLGNIYQYSSTPVVIMFCYRSHINHIYCKLHRFFSCPTSSALPLLSQWPQTTTVHLFHNNLSFSLIYLPYSRLNKPKSLNLSS